MSDKVKPGRGIDGNKDVGYQVKGVDQAAQKKMYGGALSPGTKSGGEAS